jgi:UDPglucose--hexose-1-phosphate uridylyltransferase
MPELRLNLLTREWVIITKEKGKRPEDFIGARERKKFPEYVNTCPFCKGNESRTSEETYSVKDEHGWKIRVVSNRFSVLSKDGDRWRHNSEIKKLVNGVGIHELIIESPYHNVTTATMSTEQIKELLFTYKERFVEAYNDKRVENVLIFKNSGERSGTPVEHPISQVVGIPVTPRRVRSRIENALKFFDDTGDCLMCRIAADEINDGARILTNTEHFVSFVPFAALSPFHTWIFPKRHSGAFSDIRPEEVWDLAVNLKTTMSRLYYGLENPDFNYVIRSGNLSHCNSEYMHWYITIVPRVATVSGFEMGTGMYINPVAPENAAGFLRGVRIPDA